MATRKVKTVGHDATTTRSRDVVSGGLKRGDTHPTAAAATAAIGTGPTTKVVVEGQQLTQHNVDEGPLAHVTKTLQENATKVHETKPRRVVKEEAPAASQGRIAGPAGDSRLTVKAYQKGFYAGQRIRKGQAFTLERAEDFSERWMIHVEPGTVNDLPAIHPKMVTDREGNLTGKTGYADADESVLGVTSLGK
jgi:hypothetical protein